jgi:glycerophosphoryl diester phosphodiesterase
LNWFLSVSELLVTTEQGLKYKTFIKGEAINTIMKKNIKIATLVIVIYLAMTLSYVPSINAESEFPLVLGAHRGNSVDYSENTISAINNALEDSKYEFIEFDIQYSKDKQIVVFHDLTLFRMQNNHAKISDLTYLELSEISTYHIPLYEEVMNLIGNKKRVNIEIKSQGNFEDDKEIVDLIIKDCKERGILDLILISSISSEVINYVSEHYPELKTGKIYLLHPVTYLPSEYLVEKFYQEMEEMGVDYIMLHGINMKNYTLLTKLKPKDKTLVFWYFNDQMFMMQKDSSDLLW